MDVEGVFPFLKSEGVEFIKADTRTLVDPIHIDVLVLFRAYIISTETSIQTRIAKREIRTPGVAGTDPDIHNTATATVLGPNTTDGSSIHLSISQGSQTYSAKQYMKELNRSKQEKTLIIENQQWNVNQL
ncbi:hypothetical protein BGZ80_002045 [Entomortierella chlamydospora]|uniref:Uncharacterized protein n=1 Tax=Entomortierella chlamydospora TaxID=101097 RepID=A0A9P6MQL9_9FUNG|nr:hypothetical protein BGZ80_002045 [Entomortierella chlamydospora]